MFLMTQNLPFHLVHSAGIFKQSMRARNRVEIGFSYRPARLRRLAEFISWNRFLGFLEVQKFGLSFLVQFSVTEKDGLPK
jgi:hypothetical protein